MIKVSDCFKMLSSKVLRNRQLMKQKITHSVEIKQQPKVHSLKKKKRIKPDTHLVGFMKKKE